MHVTYYLLGLTTAMVPFVTKRSFGYGMLILIASCAVTESMMSASALGYLLVLFCLTLIYFQAPKIKPGFLKTRSY